MENRECSRQNKLACFIGKNEKFKLFEARATLSFFLRVKEPSFCCQFIYDFVQQVLGLGEDFNLGQVNANA